MTAPEYPIEFFGKLVPDHVVIDRDEIIGMQTWHEHNISYNYRLTILGNIFTCAVAVVQPVFDFMTLHNLVLQTCGFRLDLLNYVRGTYLEFYFTGAIDRASGRRYIFVPEFASFAEDASQRRPQLQHRLYVGDPTGLLAAALADFRNAMKTPYDSAFFCLRSIESLAWSVQIAPSERKEKVF